MTVWHTYVLQLVLPVFFVVTLTAFTAAAKSCSTSASRSSRISWASNWCCGENPTNLDGWRQMNWYNGNGSPVKPDARRQDAQSANIYTPCPGKKRPQYTRHSFDNFSHSFIIFGTNHLVTAYGCFETGASTFITIHVLQWQLLRLCIFSFDLFGGNARNGQGKSQTCPVS